MMQVEESLKEVMGLLSQIQSDDCIPRNVKIRLMSVSGVLTEKEKALSIRVDKSIQELDEIAEDQLVPIHVRAQLWDIVSKLECV